MSSYIVLNHVDGYKSSSDILLGADVSQPCKITKLVLGCTNRLLRSFRDQKESHCCQIKLRSDPSSCKTEKRTTSLMFSFGIHQENWKTNDFVCFFVFIFPLEAFQSSFSLGRLFKSSFSFQRSFTKYFLSMISRNSAEAMLSTQRYFQCIFLILFVCNFGEAMLGT